MINVLVRGVGMPAVVVGTRGGGSTTLAESDTLLANASLLNAIGGELGLLARSPTSNNNALAGGGTVLVLSREVIAATAGGVPRVGSTDRLEERLGG